MKLPFEWHRPGHVKEVDEVVLETKTITTVITQMATALIAVVRGAASVEEVADDQ